MKRSKTGLIAGLIALWIAIPGTIVISLVLLAAIPAVGGRIYNLIPSRRRTRETLRAAFDANGLNPDWIDAIGYVESRWNHGAINRTGSDLLRGGSYGATQMSWKTLQGIGYTGSLEAFIASPEIQAKWSAIYMKRGNPKTFMDAVAWWNAGRKRFADLPADNTARTTYWPKAEKALTYVQSNPPERQVA